MNVYNKGNQSKNPMVRALIFIAILILAVTILSRVMTGETLDEYAKANPEIAYGGSEEDPSSDVSDPSHETSGQDPEAQDGSVSEPEKSSDPDSSVRQDVESGSESSQDVVASHSSDDASISASSDNDSYPTRVTHRDNFYYDFLTEEQINRITGVSYPSPDEVPNPEIAYDDLRFLHVLYVDFDGETKEGEMICNALIADDLVEIFAELYDAGYQIEKMVLIDEYDGDDDLSCADNNTSCFNYRVIAGSTHLSNHAYGLAVDINPFYNPYITYNKDGTQNVTPAGSEAYADRTAAFPYKIDTEDLCYRLFTEHGFKWGGNWNSVKDYQHFEKKF